MKIHKINHTCVLTLETNYFNTQCKDVPEPKSVFHFYILKNDKTINIFGICTTILITISTENTVRKKYTRAFVNYKKQLLRGQLDDIEIY